MTGKKRGAAMREGSMKKRGMAFTMKSEEG